jgi:putative membrane protein
MRRLILRVILLGVAFMFVTNWVTGLRLNRSDYAPFWAALIFIGINLLISPIVWILRIITLPISLLTLGMMSLVISFAFNVFTLAVMGYLEWGLKVEGTKPLLLGALALSSVNFFFSLLLPRKK